MTIIETPVPLLQHHDEFTQLLDLYRQIKPERVLEVGTYHGGSLYHWLQNAAPKATIVTIDSYTTGVDNSDQYTNWATSNADVVVIRGDSNDPHTAAMAAEQGPYQWIYIDADHHEHAVRQDWQLYSPLAAPGGYVILHDISESSDPTIQVAPLWAELANEWETVEFRSDGGWGIGIVLMP